MRQSLGDDWVTDVLKALGDPARWSIVNQIAAVDELPCATLEETLPLSKPTISYHAKILQNAGLLKVRKQARNYFYSLRADVLRDALEQLALVLPAAEVPDDVERRPRPGPSSTRSAAPADDVAAGAEEVAVLTW